MCKKVQEGGRCQYLILFFPNYTHPFLTTPFPIPLDSFKQRQALLLFFVSKRLVIGWIADYSEYHNRKVGKDTIKAFIILSNFRELCTYEV